MDRPLPDRDVCRIFTSQHADTNNNRTVVEDLLADPALLHRHTQGMVLKRCIIPSRKNLPYLADICLIGPLNSPHIPLAGKAPRPPGVSLRSTSTPKRDRRCRVTRSSRAGSNQFSTANIPPSYRTEETSARISTTIGYMIATTTSQRVCILPSSSSQHPLIDR